MSGFSVDVSELNKLAADLGKGSLRMVHEAGKAVEKATRDTERDAKAACPTRTGTLARSITSTIRGLTGETGPTAFYGGFVEDGTSDTAPAAFVGPAFDRNAPPFVAGLGDLTKDILK